MHAAASILMISAEASPFAKTGGLADAVPPLARALAARGHEVRLVLPRYYGVDRNRLERCGFDAALEFLGRPVRAAVFETRLPGSAIPVYFIEGEEFFGRDGIYGPAGGGDYPDNPARFAFFGRACFALCRGLGWFPDIVHAHDWAAGLALAYLDIDEGHAGFGSSAGVLTIHNIAYQGLFAAEGFAGLDLPSERFQPGSFEYFGRLNLLQGIIRHSRAVGTVSPGYAGEITTSRFGFGLEGILQEKRASLHGILNGLDYHAWNPAADPSLASGFDADNPAGKAVCKGRLQERCGLPVRADLPLIGMVSRLNSQKGFIELLAPGGLEPLLSEGRVQMVILGSGETWCAQGLENLARRHGNLVFLPDYREELAHQVMAGCDFLLMPSLIEPCGESQLAALRYGAIPIAPPLGGLRDTLDFAPDGDEPAAGAATAFGIRPPVSPDSISQAVRNAMDSTPARLAAMRREGMRRRFEWAASAEAYAQVYARCLEQTD